MFEHHTVEFTLIDRDLINDLCVLKPEGGEQSAMAAHASSKPEDL